MCEARFLLVVLAAAAAAAADAAASKQIVWFSHLLFLFEFTCRASTQKNNFGRWFILELSNYVIGFKAILIINERLKYRKTDAPNEYCIAWDFSFSLLDKVMTIMA